MGYNEEIQKLEDIVNKNSDGLISGSWAMNILFNKNTLSDCQIIEACDSDGMQRFMPPHRHALSKEIFYQVRGHTTFADGFVLNVGELRVIPPGDIHSAAISPGGACIIIVHPIEPAYKV